MREPQIRNLLFATLGLVLIALLATTGLFFFISQPDTASQSVAEHSAIVIPTGSLEAGPIENGIDVESGFVAEGEYLLVKQTCTACHSAKLVLQNRASREGWEEMIRWMQETQKLWDLGDTEGPVLDYLARHYAPEKKGRRVNLVVDEWYEIE